jgi:hypothetical protein
MAGITRSAKTSGDLLGNNFAARDRGKPKASSAIGAIQHGFRVAFPTGLDLIAWHVTDTPNLTGALVPDPKIPDSMLKVAVRKPGAIWR